MSHVDNPQDAGNRRKVILINPRFQVMFMSYMVVMTAVAIGIFYGANVYFFNEFRQMGMALGLPGDHVFFQFLTEQRTRMNVIFGVGSLCAFGALSLSGLFLSHRVAGPLYRLNKHMKDVAAGRTLRDVKFRKKDFFPELADSYNDQLKLVRGGSGQGTGTGQGQGDRGQAA